VLAGGLGTRMRPATDAVPKVLLPVAGRPFVAWQLAWLRTQGVTGVVLSLGHLGEQVEAYVGDGSAWGLEVRCVYDGGRLLGTGGAIERAVSAASLDEAFFVVYGDSYLQVDLAAVAAAHRASARPALMTVYANAGRWDSSNVRYRGGAIELYDKRHPTPDMGHIDYGLMVLTPGLVTGAGGPAGSADGVRPWDLADLLHDLSRRDQLAAFEVTDRFYEIGSPAGLAELEALLRRG
jgi:NDP-sugar pyrophosphorylase family protein